VVGKKSNKMIFLCSSTIIEDEFEFSFLCSNTIFFFFCPQTFVLLICFVFYRVLTIVFRNVDVNVSSCAEAHTKENLD
jgi:hypothetical protein